jgi:hypothetical protein
MLAHVLVQYILHYKVPQDRKLKQKINAFLFLPFYITVHLN